MASRHLIPTPSRRVGGGFEYQGSPRWHAQSPPSPSLASGTGGTGSEAKNGVMMIMNAINSKQ